MSARSTGSAAALHSTNTGLLALQWNPSYTLTVPE